MRNMCLDFISSSRIRPSVWIMAASLMLLAVALRERYLLIGAIEGNNQRIALISEEVSSLERELSVSGPRIDGIQEVMRTKDVPWERAISALQRSSGEKITLDRLQSTVGNAILVSGRAESSTDFVAYLQRLAETNEFKNIAPISQQKDEQNIVLAATAIAFELSVGWE